MTSHITARVLAIAILAAIALGVPVTAQRVSDTELLLREALHKQQVEGDLPGAIKIYQQIVSARNGSRAVTARALLELAGCYEKLGQQADSVYQRIVREFADQPAAAQARTKLASLRPPAPPPTMTLRKLEVAEGILWVIATDGQRAVYAAQPRTLMFGDLAGRTQRTLVEFPPGIPVRATVSRDLSSVLMHQRPTPTSPFRFSVIKTDGSAPRVIDLQQNGRPFPLNGLGPLSVSWSWDNRYLLMAIPAETGSQLLRVAVADGEVTDALHGRTGATSGDLSPDNKWIAYREELIMGGPIYVMPASGGERHLIATESGLVGWTRDGRHLLVSEAATDGWALSAIPVENGRKAGERIRLRSIPAPQVRTMANGSLFVSTSDTPLASREVWAGVVSDDDSSITWTALDLVGMPIASTFAAWLPDASRFAYVTGGITETMRVVRVKNVATGDDRELYRGDGIIGCVAAHQVDLLYCAKAAGTDTQIVSVSLDGGRVQGVGAVAGRAIVEHITSDDGKIVFYDGQRNSWFEWEIATGGEAPVTRYRSADGRWSLNGAADSTERRGLHVRPAASGGEWRFLATRNLAPPGGWNAIPVRFSPDGNWLVYHDRDTNGKDGLYRVATAGGGEPQRLGDYPTMVPSSALSISDDGRHFVVHAAAGRPPQRDYWVLENFLPAPSAAADAVKKAVR